MAKKFGGKTFEVKKLPADAVKSAKVTGSWTVRTSDGRIQKVTPSLESAASMDRAVKRYTGALKNLAKK